MFGMQKPLSFAPTRRLMAHYLGISLSTPAPPEVGGVFWDLRWLGCHGGAGVGTLLKLTGIGHDAGKNWPSRRSDCAIPVVLVCRATAAGTAKAATAVQQWRASASLRHVRLLGLVAVAASPKAVPTRVSDRLMLMRGWLPHYWWI